MVFGFSAVKSPAWEIFHALPSFFEKDALDLPPGVITVHHCRRTIEVPVAFQNICLSYPDGNASHLPFLSLNEEGNWMKDASADTLI
jgi:hypothetical protein